MTNVYLKIQFNELLNNFLSSEKTKMKYKKKVKLNIFHSSVTSLKKPTKVRNMQNANYHLIYHE